MLSSVLIQLLGLFKLALFARIIIDYIRMFAEQIRPAIQNLGRRYEVLGTDGFGRSDTRENLRQFFEVDRHWIVLTALKALADSGQLERQKVTEAIQKYGIDTNKPNPLTV